MLVVVKNFDAIKYEGTELEEKKVFKIFKKNLEEFSTKWWILSISFRSELEDGKTALVVPDAQTLGGCESKRQSTLKKKSAKDGDSKDMNIWKKGNLKRRLRQKPKRLEQVLQTMIPWRTRKVNT